MKAIPILGTSVVFGHISRLTIQSTQHALLLEITYCLGSFHSYQAFL
jgi:hypothetical protein